MTKCSNYPALQSMRSPGWRCFASLTWHRAPAARAREGLAWGALPAPPNTGWRGEKGAGFAAGTEPGSRDVPRCLQGPRRGARLELALLLPLQRSPPRSGRFLLPAAAAGKEGSIPTCLAINSAGKAGASSWGQQQPALPRRPRPRQLRAALRGQDPAASFPPCEDPRAPTASPCSPQAAEGHPVLPPPAARSYPRRF